MAGYGGAMLFNSHGIGGGGQGEQGEGVGMHLRVTTKIGKRMMSRMGTDPDKGFCSLQYIQTPG